MVNLLAVNHLNFALKQLRDSERANVQRLIRSIYLRDDASFLHLHAIPRHVRPVRENLAHLRVRQCINFCFDRLQEVWLPIGVVCEEVSVEEQIEHGERSAERQPGCVRRRFAERLKRNRVATVFIFRARRIRDSDCLDKREHCSLVCDVCRLWRAFRRVFRSGIGWLPGDDSIKKSPLCSKVIFHKLFVFQRFSSLRHPQLRCSAFLLKRKQSDAKQRSHDNHNNNRNHRPRRDQHPQSEERSPHEILHRRVHPAQESDFLVLFSRSIALIHPILQIDRFHHRLFITHLGLRPHSSRTQRA
mmetsp:Transcript_16582/g.36035  ORF Transcript_16582/g.36035 Transcript_16582/m.36035 type:complete len:302 (-) Transcript_16582:22-927(-)